MEELNNEITTNKAIDIAISIFKKDYPFVVGYEIISNIRNFTVDICLNINIDEVSKFYNSGLKDYYLKYKDELFKTNFPYQISPLKMSEEISNDDKYSLYREMCNYLNEIYEYIPNEHKIINPKWGEPKEIEIDGFKFVK